ncbi:MAG TPA: hypothetical protein VFQ53_03505 [Kofleriaceae bacterium]|nr:hypothetical protein [Kofleriaceae bacterium]
MPLDPARVVAWVQAQIDERCPPPTPQPGAGAMIQELASTLRALEAGGGQVFGMAVAAEVFPALQPLAARARAALQAWSTSLARSHGDDGPQMVRTIAARVGVELEPGGVAIAEDAAFEDTLAQLARLVGDREQLTAWWREQGQLVDDDSVITVEIGEPQPERVQRAMALHRDASGWELPAAYAQLLDRCHGISVFESEPGEQAALRTVHPTQLSEPLIWPVESHGDHALLDAVELPGIDDAHVFGELPDRGYLVIAETGAVYWVPAKLTQPTRLAESFAAFVAQLLEYRLCMPALLAARG